MEAVLFDEPRLCLSNVDYVCQNLDYVCQFWRMMWANNKVLHKLIKFHKTDLGYVPFDEVPLFAVI
jgi:hypothetical protein